MGFCCIFNCGACCLTYLEILFSASGILPFQLAFSGILTEEDARQSAVCRDHVQDACGTSVQAVQLNFRSMLGRAGSRAHAGMFVFILLLGVGPSAFVVVRVCQMSKAYTALSWKTLMFFTMILLLQKVSVSF